VVGGGARFWAFVVLTAASAVIQAAAVLSLLPLLSRLLGPDPASAGGWLLVLVALIAVAWCLDVVNARVGLRLGIRVMRTIHGSAPRAIMTWPASILTSAKIARLRFPDSAVPESLRDNFSRMSEVCLAMIRLANQSLKDRDAVAALRMAEIDHEMDHLRRDHFGVLLGENWSGSVEQAIDVALLGRYFERFADHAVAVARRVIYIITGQFPEGEEWPNA